MPQFGSKLEMISEMMRYASLRWSCASGVIEMRLTYKISTLTSKLTRE